MKPIQILMDPELLASVDRAAKRLRSDRSKLVRMALSRFLADERRRELEERHRSAYRRQPQRADEVEPWIGAQAWPEE